MLSFLQYLSFFERVLESNFSRFGGWVAQRTLTIADLRLYQLHSWLSGSFGACLNGDRLDGMTEEILNGFPLLELHKERVEELCDVVAYRSQFSWPYSTFDFSPDEVSGGDEENEHAYRISGASGVPRLTLTHAEETLDVEPIRLAAVIGKVRKAAISQLVDRSHFRSVLTHLSNSCHSRTRSLNQIARNGGMFMRDVSI